MGIRSLKESKILRARFKRFGRAGISERAINLAKKLVENPTYFNAINTIGKMHALIICAREDCYWDEKSYHGYIDEYNWLINNKANITKDEKGETVSVELVREDNEK